jgi:hypothetical protein
MAEPAGYPRPVRESVSIPRQARRYADAGQAVGVLDELWERIEPLLPARERRFAIRADSRSMTDSSCRGSRLCCLRAWQRGGVWERLPALLPAERRQRRGKTGPSPVDRGRPGRKHHLLVDGTGVKGRRQVARAEPKWRVRRASIAASAAPAGLVSKVSSSGRVARRRPERRQVAE